MWKAKHLQYHPRTVVLDEPADLTQGGFQPQCILHRWSRASLTDTTRRTRSSFSNTHPTMASQRHACAEARYLSLQHCVWPCCNNGPATAWAGLDTTEAARPDLSSDPSFPDILMSTAPPNGWCLLAHEALGQSVVSSASKRLPLKIST